MTSVNVEAERAEGLGSLVLGWLEVAGVALVYGGKWGREFIKPSKRCKIGERNGRSTDKR